MQLAAGKNDFTDKDAALLYSKEALESIESKESLDEGEYKEISNKQFYHENFKPGKIIEMSDRSYVVAPSGCWYKFTNEEEYNHLVYNVFKNKFM